MSRWMCISCHDTWQLHTQSLLQQRNLVLWVERIHGRGRTGSLLGWPECIATRLMWRIDNFIAQTRSQCDIWVLVHGNCSALCSCRNDFPHSLELKKNHAKSRWKLCEHATATQNHAKITLSKIHKEYVFGGCIVFYFKCYNRKSRPCTRMLSKCTMNTRFKQNGGCTIT